MPKQLDRQVLLSNIAQRAREMKLSDRALSIRGGLNEDAMKNLRQAKAQHPRIDTIYGFAQALECSVSQLIGEEPTAAQPRFPDLSEEGLMELIAQAIRMARAKPDLTPEEIADLAVTACDGTPEDGPLKGRLTTLVRHVARQSGKAASA